MIAASYITRDSVRAALQALVYTARKPTASDLEKMVLVDLALEDSTIPAGAPLRTFALNQLLTTLIREELHRHRRALAVTVSEDEFTLDSIQAAIARDAATSSPELIGWSWLYYHFVRVEFNLTLKQFLTIACVEERTLRRYQDHVIQRLTLLLISQEWVVRQNLQTGTAPS